MDDLAAVGPPIRDRFIILTCARMVKMTAAAFCRTHGPAAVRPGAKGQHAWLQFSTISQTQDLRNISCLTIL